MDQIAFLSGFSSRSSGPAYRRLASALADAIRAGTLREGVSLPTERSLSESLSLSRATIRAAYRQLAEEGLIDIKPGSGNYVRGATQPFEQPLWLLSSFSDDMEKRGRSPATRLLELTRGVPNEREQEALGISADEQVVRLTRLRLADGRPVAIETACLPESLLRDAHLGEGSLYAELRRLGLQPTRGVQRLRAVDLPSDVAKLLAVPAGASAMLLERVTYLSDGQPIEYTKSHYRGDAYDFVAQLNAGDLK